VEFESEEEKSDRETRLKAATDWLCGDEPGEQV
jgi:hypothetical protein